MQPALMRPPQIIPVRSELAITPHFDPIFDETHPEYKKKFKVWRGGRGGSKSWQLARGLLVRGQRSSLNILCTREFQNSIGDSVLAVLEQQAVMLGMQDYYRFTKNNIFSRTNNTRFIFKGLRKNIQSIRSTEGIDIAWLEEAQTTSAKSLKDLLPTIRKPKSEVWVTYNPDQADDPIHKWANSLTSDRAFVCTINYTDNPWIDKDFIVSAEEMRARDYDEYAHVYLGQCWSRSDAQILNGRWRVDGFEFTKNDDGVWCLNGEARSDIHGPYFGADWGFSLDPTVLIRCFIVGDVLYVDYEFSKVKLEIMDIGKAFKTIPGASDYKIRADSARPETISHVSKELNIVPVDKWKGSVEDGIAHLRGYREIILHPRCKETIQECRLYSHKVDKLTGDVLKQIVDKNNHCIDALRYALNDIIKRPQSGDVVFL